MNKHNNSFMLCTCCLTFNHSCYIEDAMKGFVMQQTTFPYVCVIIDDASTDKTPQIILDYLCKNFDSHAKDAFRKETDYANIFYAPHKDNKNCYFAVLLLKENHYNQKMDKLHYIKDWRETVKYNALCEGDDYWVDPLKIQKQVDYLEKHPNVSFVFTARYVDDERQKKRIAQKYRLRNYTKNDILAGFNPGLQNICFRTEVQKNLNKYPSVNWDRILPYLASMMGEIHCINDITSVYRVTGKGLSTSIQDDEWFLHATKDLYMFHQSVGNNDKKPFCIGMTRYVSNYLKSYPFKQLASLFPNLYKSIHGINKNITFLDVIYICCLMIKNKILKKLDLGDVQTRKIKVDF